MSTYFKFSNFLPGPFFYILFFDDSTRWFLKRNLCVLKEEHKAFPAFHHGCKVLYPLPSSDTQNTLSKQSIDS